MAFLYISNLISVTIFLTIGRIINLIIFQELRDKNNIIYDVLSGVVYLSFIALIINFFLPLNQSLNNFFLIISIIFLFLIYKKNNENILDYLKIIFFIGTISFFVMVLDNSYNPDAGLYHFPYISILNEYKIVIGLSNIHFRFGHTSIIQYTSAIFNNSIFLTKGITIPIAVILSSLFLFFINKIFSKKNNYFFLIFFFLISAFILLKNNRYNDIGNDVIGHLFYFLVLSIFLRQVFFKKSKYIDFFYLSLFSIFAFANKVFLVISFIFPIFFILYHQKYKYLFNLKNFILIIFLLSIFIKNILVSSCIIYPIDSLCFKNFSWSATKKNMHGSYERRGLESEVAAKGWADLGDTTIKREEFNKNFKWLPTWLDKHFKYLLIKIIPLIFVIIFLILILHKFEKRKLSKKKDDKNKIIEKIFLLSFSINLIGLILWFIKFPLYMYGYSFIVSAIILMTSFCLYKLFVQSNIEKISKILKYFIIILIVYVSSSYLKRIIVQFDNKYNDYPWPKIYAYDETNLEQKNSEVLFLNDFKIYNPKYRLCMYSKGPCTHFEEVNKQIKVKNKLSYNIIIPSIF